MATMIHSGAGTMNINQSRRVVEMSDTIYLLEPNAAPLYVLVSKLKKKSVTNPKYEWMEDDLNPKYTTFQNAGTSAITTIKAAASYINEYDVIKNTDTGELMLVTVSGVSATVVRGWGTSTAAAITAGDTLHIIGSAFKEGALLSDVNVLSTQVSNLYNNTQIFRKRVEITGTLEASDLYGGNDRQYQRKKKGIELMRDFETNFWWGVRAETLLSGATHYTRTMAGVDYFVTTNSTTSIGTLTETEFETALRGPFRYGNNQKYMFASPLIISVISQWAQGKLEMVPKDKTYGIAITQYTSPHGTLNLVKENLFETDTAGTAFIVELGELQYVYLNGRDVKLETNLGTDGDDISIDQYICEIGMEIHSEKKHGKLAGVTG